MTMRKEHRRNATKRNVHKTSNAGVNVTLRHVPATTVAVENNVLHILSVCFTFSHPACNSHAPYFHLWPVRLCYIFPHYLIKGTVFRNAIGHEVCFFILTTSLPELFFVMRITV